MTAVISSCGSYRYRLERNIGLYGPTAAVIMVNPSTADADSDDATIRRVVGFCKRFGWSRLIVGNVFAFRATEIGNLSLSINPVGPDNAAHLRSILMEADLVVVAWGRLGKLPPALRQEWRNVAALAEALCVGLKCLGITKDGQPKHPLMLNYSSELVDWRVPPTC